MFDDARAFATIDRGARVRHSEIREIDPKRIYVAGFSGGGNMSCLLTFHYPEVFSGGIYMAPPFS